MDHIYVQENPEDKLREECGVFGAYDFGGGDVASTVYYGLLALQHRGQESCGIAVSDTEGPKGTVFSHKDMGLVNEAFAPEHLEQLNSGSVEEAVGRTMGRQRGSYSLVVMSPRKLIGARDPYGFRPLCIGKRDQMYLLSSERDVSHMIPQERTGRCIFEYIYFARPDSMIDGISVYHSRILAGKFLAMDAPADADLVVGVPESGNCAAMGYSMQSGIPYGIAFMKNTYVGRTFIKPRQESRESGVQVKLNPIREAVEGKRVILIDDSIVRGTTSDRIVRMLRDAGAREVHMRVSSPPFLWPCYFGTDVPEKEQLIANGRSTEEIRQIIGSDSLEYLGIERLEELVGGAGICKGCFTGNYPVEAPDTKNIYAV